MNKKEIKAEIIFISVRLLTKSAQKLRKINNKTVEKPTVFLCF